MQILPCLLVATAIVSYASVSPAADLCDRIREDSRAADNASARERAAIADLRHVTIAPIKDSHSKNEISYEEYVKLTDRLSNTLACINAESELKYWMAAYNTQTRLIEAKCIQGPVEPLYTKALAYRTAQKAKDCVKADLEHVAALIKQMKDIQAAKLAKEEPSTPAVKRTDSSQKNGDFCKTIRTVSGEAASFFKAIKRERKDPWFIAPDTVGKGSPGVKEREIVAIDSYATSVSLPQGFLTTPTMCEVRIGTHANLQVRIVPEYHCEWDIQQTTRRELEEKTDNLFAQIRGCYDTTAENEDYDLYRHSFVGNGSAEVTGALHFGDGKPSTIFLDIFKHTPEEDKACTRFGIFNRSADKLACLRRYSQE